MRNNKKKAEEQVDDFIENHVGDEFNISPEDLTPHVALQEFREFLDQDSLDKYQESALQDRYEDIESELQTSPYGVGSIPIQPDPEIIAMNRQIETHWNIHTDQRFNRNYRQWIQTLTEMRSLQDERQEHLDRYNSLDPSRIKDTLRAGVVTISLSVGVPLVTYLAHTLITFETRYYWIEPLLVFIIWAIGLGYVFEHIRRQIGDETEEIPEEPDVRIDDSNSEDQ